MQNARQVPDYTQYSDEDLKARAKSVNRSQFIERAAIIDSEIAARQPQLALRRERFAAAIIDFLVNAICIIPLIVLLHMGVLTGHPLTIMMYGIAWSILVLIIVHGYTLLNYSQSIGKYHLGIRIEMIEGGRANFSTILIARYLPMLILTAIPFIGGLFGLINVLFIFRQDKRCLHDFIAGTRVCRLPTQR